MATLYSDQYPELIRPDTRPNDATVSRPMRMIDVTYTMAGDEAANDVIRLAPLHQGEKVYPQLSDMDIELDIATAATISVGDDDGTDDDDAYATGLAAANAARVAFDETHDVAERVITEECWLTATFETMTTPIVGGRVRFRVMVGRSI